jgi:hypothetical protein
MKKGTIWNEKVSIDSNSLTYLLEAISSGYDPQNDKSDLTCERVAMIRIFLYRDISFFYILFSVKKEYLRITDERWRREHKELVNVLLRDLNLIKIR